MRSGSEILFWYREKDTEEKPNVILRFTDIDKLEKTWTLCKESLKACSSTMQKSLKDSVEDVQVGLDRLQQAGLLEGK